MKLHELSPAEGSTTNRKRKGRGVASGNGKTAGRGYKGLKARSGGSVRPGFEGGQMPIYRRLPKRGFTNIFRKELVIVNVGDLSRFEANQVIDEKALVESGLVKQVKDGVKILGNGELNIALTVKVARISESAKAKIVAAGGTVEG